MAQRKRRMKAAAARNRRRLPVRRKLLFAGIVTLLVFGSLEAALWLIGIQPAWVLEDPYAGFSRHIPHFVEDGDNALMNVSPTKTEVLNPQSFTADKPDDVYRIVCLGGSTTYGRPFYDLTSFPGWLRAFLSAAQPSQKWEVINAGGISYASYRVQGVMEELAEYDPDLFVVYTGQNEFLERRTYADLPASSSSWAGPTSLIYQTRTATVVRGVLDATGLRRGSTSDTEVRLGEDTKAIPLNAVGPEAYHRDAALRDDIVTHFRSTLHAMIQRADQVGADIVFVVPASNLADFAPFKSEHRDGISDADLAAWNKREILARSLASQGKHAEVLTHINEALAVDDRYAGLWYFKGRTLLELKDYEGAKQAFQRAVNEDVCPLRAIDPLVSVVRNTRDVTGKNVVDFEQLVTEHSPHGIAGVELFHDHVHPTIEGNRLLALAILDELQQRGIVSPAESWNEAAMSTVTEDIRSRIDQPLHAKQLRLLAALLGWLNQPDAARVQAEQSLELSGQTADALIDLAKGFQANQSPQLAGEYFENAATSHPSSARAHFEYGVYSLDAGSTDRGIEHLKTAIAADSNFTDARVRLGVALARNGELQSAEEQLKTAAQLAPDSAVVHNNLGLVIAKQGRYQEAVEHYRTSLSLDANASSTHFNAALAYEQLGEFSKARSHYEATVRLANGHPEAEARLQAMLNR